MGNSSIGEISIDMSNLASAKVQCSNGKEIGIACSLTKIDNEQIIKVFANYENLDVEANIIVYGTTAEIKLSVDDSKQDTVARVLPTPDIVKVEADTLNFGLEICNRENTEKLQAYVNCNYTGKIYIENLNRYNLANMSVLGDRISGYVSCNSCDEIRLQMLVLMTAVIILKELRRGSNEAIISRLKEQESIIGQLCHTRNLKTSVTVLLNQATGDK